MKHGNLNVNCVQRYLLEFEMRTNFTAHGQNMYSHCLSFMSAEFADIETIQSVKTHPRVYHSYKKSKLLIIILYYFHKK